MRKKGWKKIMGMALACCFMAGLATMAEAKSGTEQQRLEYRDIKVTLNGQALDLQDAQGNSVEPFMFNGTNYLPVRALSESLGMGVSWDSSTNTVQLTRGATLTQEESVMKLGYYKILEENMTDIQEFFYNCAVNVDLYTNAQMGGKDIASGTKSKIESRLDLAEGHYSSLKSAGLLTEDDIEMMVQYRALEQQSELNLKTLLSSPSSSQINTISDAAYKYQMNSLLAEEASNTAFWDAYQAAFN